MGYINVTVYDSTENKRVPVELPDDAPCNKIIAVLVQKLKLPANGPDGAPLSYKFHHKNSGRQVQDTQTLAEAAVKDGDILRLQPEITGWLTMATDIRVAPSDLQDDRYSRLRLIPWWDEAKIRAARLLVVGAGALGNEILKNLALLGFRNIVVVDLERIEESNLSRAVLFRESDVGQSKAQVAARSVRAISSDATVQPIVGDIIHQLGLGLFAWCDVVIAGLDNREARLWINRAAWKTNRPWIDGAIEGINGVVRVFKPGEPPCYECTLGATDWELLERKMSCNLLLREADVQGKVATTPTISSIIAGMQVQELLKLIHGLPTLAGRGYIFEGLNHTSYVVEYTANDDCMSHYTFDRVVPLPESSHELTLEQLRRRAQQDLHSAAAVVEFSRDIIHQLVCPHCNAVEAVFAPVGTIGFEQGRCPQDGHMRRVVTLHSYSGESGLADRTLDQLGLPPFDIFVGRCGEDEIAYLIAGDREQVLGPLGGLV